MFFPMVKSLILCISFGRVAYQGPPVARPAKINLYKTYLMLSMKWVLNNSYLSFGQSQGDTYWKGLFIECRSDMQVGGLSCDNYQYPWFIMDAIILSSRISYVLAWIFLAVSK